MLTERGGGGGGEDYEAGTKAWDGGGGGEDYEAGTKAWDEWNAQPSQNKEGRNGGRRAGMRAAAEEHTGAEGF